MAQELEQLEYTRLEQGSIRLLVLAPSKQRVAKLCASFRVVTLDDVLQYEAVSYTWGADDFPEQIHFEDGIVKITENLAAALKTFRRDTDERVLWADAVCINQKDTSEKSCQVGLMSKVYEKAQRVLIWLGDSNETSAMAMEGYRFVAGMMLGLGEDAASSSIAEDVLGFRALLEDPTALAGQYINIVQPTDILISYDMNYIYENPWFTRLWIVQEVCLAKNPIICCGTDELHWVYFAASMLLFKTLRGIESFSRNPKALLRACSIVEARAIYKIFVTFSLTRELSHVFSTPLMDMFPSASMFRFEDIVEGLRGQDCKDDRDRIYALLSLRPQDTDVGVEPDYSLPVVSVFTDYASKCLAQGQVATLYDAGLWYRGEVVASFKLDDQFLPSWVPDFRETSHRTLLPWLKYREKFPKSIHGDFSMNKDLLSDVSTGIMTELDGFILTKITTGTMQALPQMIFFGGGATTYDCTKGLMEQCLEMFKEHHSHDLYPTDEDVETAFWNTVIMEGLGEEATRMIGADAASLPSFREMGRMFAQHSLSDDRTIPDLWLYHGDLEKFNSLSVEKKIAARFYDCIRSTMDSVAFIVTESGLAGLAPPTIRIGDSIAIINGAAHPFVVREVIDSPIHMLVGPCYLYDVLKNPLPLLQTSPSISLI